MAQAEEQAEHARALAALAADEAVAESQAELGARLTEEVARHRCSAAWKTMHCHIPRPYLMLAARAAMLCCQYQPRRSVTRSRAVQGGGGRGTRGGAGGAGARGGGGRVRPHSRGAPPRIRFTPHRVVC